MAAGPLQIAKRVLVTLLAIGAVGVSNLPYLRRKSESESCKAGRGATSFFY